MLSVVKGNAAWFVVKSGLQPGTVLDIVIDKPEHIPTCVIRSKIIDAGIVEAMVPGQNPDSGVSLADLGQISQCLLASRTVVQDQHLKPGIAGTGQDCIDAWCQQIDTITRRDHQTDQRERIRQWPADTIGIGQAPKLDGGAGAASCQMVGDRSQSCTGRIILGVAGHRRGAGTDTPMIENPGNMDDAIRLCVGTDSQGQIVVLAPLQQKQ